MERGERGDRMDRGDRGDRMERGERGDRMDRDRMDRKRDDKGWGGGPGWRERRGDRGWRGRDDEGRGRDDGGKDRRPRGKGGIRRTPCKFYATNSCTKGENCTFLHDERNLKI